MSCKVTYSTDGFTESLMTGTLFAGYFTSSICTQLRTNTSPQFTTFL